MSIQRFFESCVQKYIHCVTCLFENKNIKIGIWEVYFYCNMSLQNLEFDIFGLFVDIML